MLIHFLLYFLASPIDRPSVIGLYELSLLLFSLKYFVMSFWPDLLALRQFRAAIVSISIVVFRLEVGCRITSVRSYSARYDWWAPNLIERVCFHSFNSALSRRLSYALVMLSLLWFCLLRRSHICVNRMFHAPKWRCVIHLSASSLLDLNRASYHSLTRYPLSRNSGGSCICCFIACDTIGVMFLVVFGGLSLHTALHMLTNGMYTSAGRLCW